MLKIRKLINAMHCINWLKEKNHIVIPRVAKNSFMTKALKLWIAENIFFILCIKGNWNKFLHDHLEICGIKATIRKQQLELDIKQQTGSK